MIPPPVDPSPTRPPITPLLAVMLAFIAFSLQTLVIQVLFQITGGGTTAPLGIGAIFGYGVAFMLAVAQLPGDPAAALGFRAARSRSWIAMLLFLPSPLLTSEIDNVIRERWPRPPLPEGAAASAGFPEGLAATVELAVVAILVLPVVFEIFFRGLLQPRLVPYWGSLGAVVGAALLATAGNALIDVRSLPVLLGAALLAGLLRRSSGSLYPGLLLTMSFGLTDVLALRKQFGIPGFDIVDVAHTPLAFLIAPAAMVGIGLALCRGDASLVREDVAREAPPQEPPTA